MDMFAKATRLKLRFDTPKGQLSVEELWELFLTSGTGKANLNDIAVDLHRQLRASAETVSFVTPAESADEELQLKFDIVKFIIDVRVRERDEAANAAKKRETKQRLMEILARKQDEELQNKTPEELQAMIEGL